MRLHPKQPFCLSYNPHPGREVLDDFLRQRAKQNGATLINGLFMGMALPEILGEPLGYHWGTIGSDRGFNLSSCLLVYLGNLL